MDAKCVADQLIDWIQTRVLAANCRGTVLGLSGGIDSAVVAALCRRALKDTTMGVIMPCHSMPQDEEDARLVAASLGLETARVDLTGTYDCLMAAIEQATGNQPTRLAQANTKARLRMTALYAVAATRTALVVGTGNRSELTIGYFTKHGDSGVDLLPIGGLVKTQVFELAAHLGIPEKIIRKAPSAGLWEGQTDEQEMGFTYASLDRYILSGKAEPDVAARIEQARKISEHKRSTAPVAPVDPD